jgi:large subunit ribosomal protein L12
MLYIYASLMLHAGGKEINEDNLKKVVEAAGIEPDLAQIKAVAAALKGVNIDEVIKQGLTVAPVAQPQVQAQAQPKAEEKREEKKEEEEEEVSAEGLGALFG